MCDPIPFTQAELQGFSHLEIAELLISVAIGTGDIESARICKEASERLKQWQALQDEIRADSDEFRRRYGHMLGEGNGS